MENYMLKWMPCTSVMMPNYQLTSAGLFVPFNSLFPSAVAFSLFSVTLSTATSPLLSLELIFVNENHRRIESRSQPTLFKIEDGAGFEFNIQELPEAQIITPAYLTAKK